MLLHTLVQRSQLGAFGLVKHTGTRRYQMTGMVCLRCSAELVCSHPNLSKGCGGTLAAQVNSDIVNFLYIEAEQGTLGIRPGSPEAACPCTVERLYTGSVLPAGVWEWGRGHCAPPAVSRS